MKKETIIWSVCGLVAGLVIGIIIGMSCLRHGPKHGCGPCACDACAAHCMSCPSQHFQGDSTLMPSPGCHKHHKTHCCKRHRHHAEKPCCHKQPNDKQ